MNKKAIFHVSEGQCEGSLVWREGKKMTTFAVVQTFKTGITDVLCSSRWTDNQAHQCLLYGFNNDVKCPYLKTTA